MSRIKNKFLVGILSSFWLVTLMNPVFKKYDYGAEWPMVILLCVLLLVVLWLSRRESAAWSKDIALEKIFLFVFLLFVGLSFVFSETKNIGLPEVMAYFGAVGLYLVFAYRENRWMSAFLKIVCIGATMAALLGFVIFLLKEAPPRMIGPFFNIFYPSNLWPNAFALFLLIAWPIFLLFQGEPDRESPGHGKLSHAFWLLGLSLVITALYLTYSRGAYICFIGQAALLAFYFRKSLAKFRVLKKIGVVFAAVLVFGIGASLIRAEIFAANISISERATFQNQELATSVGERVDFWIGAWNLMWDRPLVGHGPFSFKYLYEANYQTEFLAIADHPHNVFLKIGAENGVVAFSAFILFLFLVLVIWAKRFRKLEGSDKNLSFVLGASIAGGFAHNLIDYNLNFLANLILIFVLLAFFRSLVTGAVVQEFYTRSRKRGAEVLVWILSLSVFGFAVFEGSVLVAANLIDERAQELSFYPRNYYLNMADGAVQANDFALIEKAANKQLKLNPYEGQAYYLLGVSCFSALNPAFDERKAAEYFQKAIAVNPYNDLNYYREYLSALISFGDRVDIVKVKDELLAMLERYEVLIENNVHFTTYTSNADAAVGIYKILAMYFPQIGSEAEPYDIMYGEGNVSEEFLKKAEALQDTIDTIRASRKL